MKTCIKCLTEKEDGEFKGRFNRCKTCMRAYYAEWASQKNGNKPGERQRVAKRTVCVLAPGVEDPNHRAGKCRDCIRVSARKGQAARRLKQTPEQKEEDRARSRQWRRDHPEQAAASTKKWQDANPEARKAGVRAWYKKNPWYSYDWTLKTEYGLTRSDFDAMLIAQLGLCGGCSQPMSRKSEPHVDHDHATMDVRGLLCSNCNMALGYAKDSHETLISLARYLIDASRPKLKLVTAQ